MLFLSNLFAYLRLGTYAESESLSDINIFFIYFFHRRKKTEERSLKMHLKEKVKTSELFFLDFTFLNKSWSILLSLQSRTVITLGFLNSSSFNSKLLNAGILN